MIYLGADPGLSGAVAILGPSGQELIEVFSMPTLEKGGWVKRRVDASTLAELVRPYAEAGGALAAVECVGYRKGDGGGSGASLAHSFGIVEGVLGAFRATVLRPPPLTWKAAMGLKGAGKEGSMRRAAQLWPTFRFTRHDEAEAALLARFAWLQRSKINP